MLIGYSDHARDRIRERKIPKREVREALRLGSKTITQDGIRMCIHKGLVVIYDIQGPAEVIIVTAYRQR